MLCKQVNSPQHIREVTVNSQSTCSDSPSFWYEWTQCHCTTCELLIYADPVGTEILFIP